MHEMEAESDEDGVIETSDALEYAGVQCDSKGIAQFDNAGRLLLLIRRADIHKLYLRHGFQALHPVIQFSAGIVLTILGLAGIILATGVFGGGPTLPKLAGTVVFLILGPWMIVLAAWRGYFVEVYAKTGRNKLAFDRAEPSHLRQFVKAAERLGYHIEPTVPI
jgi:hypothetical protein